MKIYHKDELIEPLRSRSNRSCTPQGLKAKALIQIQLDVMRMESLKTFERKTIFMCSGTSIWKVRCQSVSPALPLLLHENVYGFLTLYVGVGVKTAYINTPARIWKIISDEREGIL